MKTVLSLGLKGADHKFLLTPFTLANVFDGNWAQIGAKCLQIVGISMSHEVVESSPIFAGLRNVVQDFTMLMLPAVNGGTRLDIPEGQAVRLCSNEWVLTRQNVDISSPGNCDKTIDDLIPLIQIPSTFSWPANYVHGIDIGIIESVASMVDEVSSQTDLTVGFSYKRAGSDCVLNSNFPKSY